MTDYSRESDLGKFAMLTPGQQANEGNDDEDRRTMLTEMNRASDPRIKAVLQHEFNRRFNGGPRSAPATSMRDGFPELRGDTGPAVTARAPAAATSGLNAFLAGDGGAAPGAARGSLADFLDAMPEAAAPKGKRTWGDAATDNLRAVAGGVNALVKTGGDLYGLVSGDMNNPVSEFGKSGQEYWTQGQSQVLKDKITARKEAIDASDSMLGKFGTAVKETLTDPALLADTVSSNLTTMIPGMGVGKVVQGGMMARALAAGPITEAAAIAAAKTGAKVATGAAVGTGAIQQGADVSAQAFDDSIAKFDTPEKIAKQLATNPIFAARVQAGEAPRAVAMELGLSAARAAFLPAAAISVASHAIPGGTMLERALIGGAARDTIKAGTKYALPKAIAKGALSEGGTETLEEGGGQFAANVAKQRIVDPNQDLTEGVGENAGMGFAGGFGLGGAGGAFHRTEKSAGDVIREDKQPGTGPLVSALNAGVEQAALKADAAQAAAPDANVPHAPRELTAAMIGAIRALPPEQQDEAMQLAATGNRADVKPGVRRYAQSRLDKLLGDLTPAADAPGAEAKPVVTKAAKPGNELDGQLARQEQDLRAADAADAAAREPALQRQPIALPVAPLVQEKVQRAFDLGNRFGLVERVEELAANGLTAQAIVNDLGPDLEPVRKDAALNGEDAASAGRQFVRDIRAGLGVPSQDDPKEFSAWQQEFNQRRIDGAQKGERNGLEQPAGSGSDTGATPAVAAAPGGNGGVVRAEREGGPGARPVAEPVDGAVPPDPAVGNDAGGDAALTHEQDTQAGAAARSATTATQATDAAGAASAVAGQALGGVPSAGPADVQAAGVAKKPAPKAIQALIDKRAARKAETRQSTSEAPADLGDDVNGHAELSDRRLAHAATAEAFKNLPASSGWSQVGGKLLRAPLEDGQGMEGAITGRTPWIPASDWYASMQADEKTNVAGGKEGVQRIVDRALAGESLSTQERRSARLMLELAEQEADPLSGLNLARDQLKAEYDRGELEAQNVDQLAPEAVDALKNLLKEAESLGLDTETIREDASRFENDKDYYEAVTSAIKDLLSGAREADQRAAAGATREGDPGRGGPADREGEAQGLTLTAPTRAEVVAQQDALDKERADKEAPSDKPASKLTGDQVDIFNPQGSWFDAPAEPSSKPSAEPSPAEKSSKDKALDDLNDALGDLAGIFGKSFKSNMMPEQEQKLLPVLTRVMDAAFRAGYYSFKEAARFVLDTIRSKIGQDVADAITLDHLQGSYIGMAGKYKEQGATSKRDVVSIDSLEELAGAPEPAEKISHAKRWSNLASSERFDAIYKAGLNLPPAFAWNDIGVDKQEKLLSVLDAAPVAAPVAPKPTMFDGLVLRQEAARQRFIDSAKEQFGLSDDEAKGALDGLLKTKLVKLDPNSGQFNLKDGRVWDKEVLLRAGASVAPEAEEQVPARPVAQRTEEKTSPKAAADPAEPAWDSATPADRRKMLTTAGYTDGDQARVLSNIDWNQLTDPVRRALDQGERQASAPTLDTPVAAAPKIVEYTTARGKTLRGVVRTDLSKDEAQAIDKFTFKHAGGFFIREKHLDELAAAHPATAATPAAAIESEAATLADTFLHEIAGGRMPKDNPALRKLVESFDGEPATPIRMKEAQEALETAIVNFSRRIVAKKEGPKTTFAILTSLYESQPLLNVRTSTSIENQAYSTPAPLAYVASALTHIDGKTTVGEPTGGNGMLLIGADPKNSTVNEINDERAASLESQGFKPTQLDAAKNDLAPSKSLDRVITNPPFGPIKDANGDSIKVKFDGYTIGQIDHLIAARALEAMKDDGRATLIIGANKVAGLQSNNDLIFFNWLYAHYNVTSHFEVDGDLYLRQGAGWPVRVITIQGRAKSDLHAPAPDTIGRATTWGEVYERFEQGLAAQRAIEATGAGPVGSSRRAANGGQLQPVSPPVDQQTGRDDAGRLGGGARSDGNVGGARSGPVVDSEVQPAQRVGERAGAVGSNDQSPGPVEGGRIAREPAAAKPAGNSGTAGVGLESADNQFQTKYVARSARKDEGVLIPVNMAGPTQSALDRLEDEVGDIDEFTRNELGYASVDDLHAAFMGLQVDSVASVINQIKKEKGVIIADQTGIGKGRQAAAIIRWAVKNGKTPVFVSAKPQLFTDMFGDLHDIGSDDIAPLILNSDAWIKGEGDAKLFANLAGPHRALLGRIAANGQLPAGRNALFMTYSQISTANVQRQAVLALAPNAVVVLDEAHTAAGESGTGTFIRDVLGLANGVVYLSATFAKRPDNMPLYFKTDMGEAVSDDATLIQAMADGGLPLQTVISNNLVKAGQMFRRERSYDGVNIESRADTGHRAEHVKLSDETTLALRAIVSADRVFHHVYVKSLQKELKKEGKRALDTSGNQAAKSVDHTQFSSVVHNFVRQMLLGLKAQEAADDAIRSIKRGEKPLIAVENTMGSLLNDYVAANQIAQGDSLLSFSYRALLSRALDRSRSLVYYDEKGNKSDPTPVKLSELDPVTFDAYQSAQAVIDKLNIDIPVSPIDWIRNEITRAGYSVAEVTGRNLSVDYSDPKRPKLDQIDAREQKDKVRTTRQFNDGTLDALVLNVSGSTGISLHASEKFKDQRQRHMIVAQAAQDINIFMQMLGRVHRTGQVKLPKYTILSADLPAEIRPTALLSGKMKSLNANTSSNTESATSVKAADMLNKYGDEIVGEYLADNLELAAALDIDPPGEDGKPKPDIARKATGRLALMPVKVQEQFYAEVEEQYRARIEYLDKTNQNELLPRTFDFDAQETKSATLFEGQNHATPFGEDAIYGEYSVKAQGKAMTPEEIRAAMTESLGGLSDKLHGDAIIEKANAEYTIFRDRLNDAQKAQATATRNTTSRFIREHAIGAMVRVDINGDAYNAVVTNIRNTHKAAGNPYSLSKIQVTIAVNGALRSVTVPGTLFAKIETSAIRGYDAKLDQLFKVGPPNERETAKIVTGNLLGAYGQLDGARGSIITFTKADGTTDQGILLPKAFNFAKDTRQDYRLKTPADVFAFLTQSQSENIERFGINSRDQAVRVLPNTGSGITIQVPKSKAKGGKYFLDEKLREATGDFVTKGGFMIAEVFGQARAEKALGVLMQKQALYALPSMAAEARTILGDPAPDAGKPAVFSRSDRSVQLPAVHRLAAATVADEVEQRIGKFAHQPPVRIRDSADGTLPGATVDDGISGAVHEGAIYLFRDQLGNRADVQRTLFHELLHYGLRRFMTREQYTAQMRQLYDRDAHIRRRADEWAKTPEAKAAHDLGGDAYVLARGVDEALAELAEPNGGTYLRQGLVARTYRAVLNWLADAAHALGFKATAAEIRGVKNQEARALIEQIFGKLKTDAPAASGDWGFTADPAFSRSLGAALGSAMTSVRDVNLPAGYKVADLMDSTGKLSFWHKTVGSQYNLAQRSPEFKRVFDGVQNFLNDASFYTHEAANLAPRVLPKLESLKDIVKSPMSAADTKAIGAPIFEGTLAWMRDARGRPVKVDDVEAAAAEMDSEQKARALFKAGNLSEQVLKMWQGLPIEQFDAIINGKYAREMMKAGVVWTPAELKSMFKATGERQADGKWSGQIGLYNEFRAATDESLTNLAVSEMLNYAGKDVAALRAQVLTMTHDDAAVLMRDHLFELAEAETDPKRSDELNEAGNKMIDIADHASDMQARGYAPLSRFGTYTLEATLATGERYFSLFETPHERARMQRQLASAGATAISAGTMSQEDYKLLNGVSPETAALFGQMLGLEEQGSGAANAAFSEYIKRGTSNRSAMKRLLKRQGVAGFSEDAGRVLAGFVYSNGRKTSANLHMGEVGEAVAGMDKLGGELKDQAVRLAEYIKNPQEEAHVLRGLLFAQYLGGSVASAMVNATQPFTVTFPYLSQYGGIRKSGARLAAALKLAGKATTGDAALDKAIELATAQGTLSPQEVHQLMAQASGKSALKSGDGTAFGDASANASNLLSKFTLAWGKVFSVAEQFNRRVTFIAAWRTAIEQGIANPHSFALKAVNETQFISNKGNKAQWGRGAIGGTLMTFRSYSIQYIELLQRMATAGEPGSPERAAGRKAALLAVAVLFLMGGADGLPFEANIEDLIDAFMNHLGYNVSTKRAKTEFFAGLLGEDMGRFVAKGLSGLPGAPIDVSGRMGMGKLIPGLGLLSKKTDHTSDVTELFGPVGDLAKRGVQAVGQVLDGDLGAAASSMSPVAMRNVAKAVDMAQTGTYRDTKGRKVIDTTATEAALKGIGFQPNSVARVQESVGKVQQQVAITRMRQSELSADMAQAMFERDQEKIADVRNMLQRWNEKNPDSRIVLSMPSVLQRVKAMREDKATRIERTAPRSMRAEVRRQLDEGRS